MKKLFLMLALLFGSMIHLVNAVKSPSDELKALLKSEHLDQNVARVKKLVRQVDLHEEWSYYPPSGGYGRQENYFSLIAGIGNHFNQSGKPWKDYKKIEILTIFLDAELKVSYDQCAAAHVFSNFEIVDRLISKGQVIDSNLILDIIEQNFSQDKKKSLIETLMAKGIKADARFAEKGKANVLLLDCYLNEKKALLARLSNSRKASNDSRADIKKNVKLLKSLGFTAPTVSQDFLQEVLPTEAEAQEDQLTILLDEHLKGTDKSIELAALLKKAQRLVSVKIEGWSIFHNICSSSTFPELQKKALKVFLDAGMKLSDESLQKAVDEYPIIFKYLIERGLYQDLLKKAEGIKVVWRIQVCEDFADEEKKALIAKCKQDGFDFNKKFDMSGYFKSKPREHINFVESMLELSKKGSEDLKDQELNADQKASAQKMLLDIQSVIKRAVAHGATITPEVKAKAEKLGLKAEIFVAPVNADGGSSGATIGSGKMFGGVVVIAGIAAAVYFYFKSKKAAEKKKKFSSKKADQKEIDQSVEKKIIREMNKKQEGALQLEAV